jgi:hypothetical protein
VPSLVAGLSQTAFGGNRNPPESSGILSKYRNSCPQEFLRKIPVKSKEKKRNSCDPSKNIFLWKIPPENAGKKEILRNPVRNVFLDPKNKFLKTGIWNLARYMV